MELQATGLFTYSNADGWKDSIRASRATAVAHIILAGIEGVGFVTADLMAIKAGNMPLAAALWTAGTYVSGETLDRGINQLQGKTGEGQRVMDSFHPDTHSGDESLLESFAPLSDIAIEGLSAGAGTVLGAGVKLASVPFVGKVKKFAGEAVYPALEKTKPFYPDKVIDPDSKHQLSELYQGRRKGMKKTDSPHMNDPNTVAFDYADIKADMEAISQGKARVNIRDGSEVYVNGRVYKHHEKEKFFPVRGDGLMNLTPGEFRAYGILNKFGDTERAREVVQLERARISGIDFKRAVEIFKENRGD